LTYWIPRNLPDGKKRREEKEKEEKESDREEKGHTEATVIEEDGVKAAEKDFEEGSMAKHIKDEITHETHEKRREPIHETYKERTEEGGEAEGGGRGGNEEEEEEEEEEESGCGGGGGGRGKGEGRRRSVEERGKRENFRVR